VSARHMNRLARTRRQPGNGRDRRLRHYLVPVARNRRDLALYWSGLQRLRLFRLANAR
jgi:hypothetical protein